MPEAYEWPGIPKNDQKDSRHLHLLPTSKTEEYLKMVHAEPSYQIAARAFYELQQHEPQPLDHVMSNFWAYKDHVLVVNSEEPEPLRDRQKEALFVKHYILRRERDYERIKREVDALENLEKLDRLSRAPIAGNVRLFVWQRDGGKCVKCGSRERLEFDHIIPFSAGGSSTERNIQLLCESSNRAKGSKI